MPIMKTSNAKLRVVVFDRRNAITEEVSNVLGDGFEIVRVNSLTKIRTLLSINPLPYYASVIFNSSDLNGVSELSLERRISSIREEDILVPHLVYGKPVKISTLGAIGRGGYSDLIHVTNFYAAENIEGLKRELGLIFMLPLTLPNLTIVKVGDSSFDFDGQTKGKNLEDVCKILVKLFRENLFLSRDNPKRVIVTAGAGEFGDITKGYFTKHDLKDLSSKLFSIALFVDSYRNLEMLHPFFGDENSFLVSPPFFYDISTDNSIGRIPLTSCAPHYIMARDGIPLQDSDTHAIALAEFYGAERIIVIKRADGIYDFDPYRGFVLDPFKGECANLNLWIETQKGNRRHSVVTIDEMLDGRILREGTGIDGRPDGSMGHLMEDSALRYFAHYKNIKEIVIVHIAPEEMHYPIGGNLYKHVVTGDEIFVDPQVGWKGILEQRIRDAFRGVALSRIVRN